MKSKWALFTLCGLVAVGTAFVTALLLFDVGPLAAAPKWNDPNLTREQFRFELFLDFEGTTAETLEAALPAILRRLYPPGTPIEEFRKQFERMVNIVTEEDRINKVKPVWRTKTGFIRYCRKTNQQPSFCDGENVQWCTYETPLHPPADSGLTVPFLIIWDMCIHVDADNRIQSIEVDSGVTGQ